MAYPLIGHRRQRTAEKGSNLIAVNRPPLPLPSGALLDNASLFLDLDGTLLEFVDDPDEVEAGPQLRELLIALKTELDGRLAVVSGRSLEQIDAILGDCASELALSGSHGCEHRWRGVLARPNRPEELDRAADSIRSFADGRPGVLLEEKSFGVALHYRKDPAAAEAALALAERLSDELGLLLQRGKMVVELRVAGGDKGTAVQRLMRRSPMRGTTPVFVGDDVTDEAGFTAARELGGHGVLVGPERPTAADYRIACPADLREWLAGVIG